MATAPPHRWRIAIAVLLAVIVGVVLVVTVTRRETPLPSDPPTPPGPGRLLFSDDFGSGGIGKWRNQSCPDGVTVASNVGEPGRRAVKFTVSDDSTRARCKDVPTESPRAQLVSPPLFKDGGTYWIGFATFFPEGFRQPPDWFQIAEIYGPPFGEDADSGAPTLGIGVCEDRLCLHRNKDNGSPAEVWLADTPIAVGTGWEDLILHVHFSTDADQGFVEIWRNGAQQTMYDGSTRVHYATLLPGINWDGSSPNTIMINQYRSGEQPMGTVDIYHSDVRIGTTWSSVARNG